MSASRRPASFVTALIAIMLVAVLGLTASPAWAATLTAADVPVAVTLAPGATGAVPWTVQNTSGTSQLIRSTPPSTMVFQAPGNSTFAAQTTVPAQSSSDGTTFSTQSYQLQGCVLSNANKTLTCQGSTSTTWPANGYFRFLPQVTIDATAPAGSSLTPGTSAFSFTGAGAAPFDTSVGTLNVSTPAVVAVRIADPSIAGIGAVMAMIGVAVVRRRRPA